MNSGGFISDFKNAFNRPNSQHTQLIIINVICFFLIGILRVIIDHTLLAKGSKVLEYLAMPSNPDELLYKPWTILTYMFTHAAIFHILFNMIVLYIFGRIIVDLLGGAKVVNLYVLGGIAGGALYVLLYNILPFYDPVKDISVLYGASAGVMAVAVGAATYWPDYTINLLFIGPVRIRYVALISVLLSFIQTTGDNAGGEIAHLGGAILGFAYMKQLQKGRDWGSWISATLSFFKSFFVKQPNIKVSYKKSKTSAPKSSRRAETSSGYNASQDEIDAILDKISEKGYESLTKDEKQKLFNASKK